jgi:hypothetical protein
VVLVSWLSLLKQRFASLSVLVSCLCMFWHNLYFIHVFSCCLPSTQRELRYFHRCSCTDIVRFEGCTAATMKNAVFWDLCPMAVVRITRRNIPKDGILHTNIGSLVIQISFFSKDPTEQASPSLHLRCSFRNAVLSCLRNIGRWTKLENSVIL